MPKTEEEKVQEGLEKSLAAAGFQEGTPPPVEDGAQPMPPAPEPPAEETTPTEPVKAAEPTDEVKRLQEEVKSLKDKADWADRAQKVADRERQRGDEARAEAERLRTALGVPAKTEERILTPEEQQSDKIATQFMRDYLPRALKEPEIVAAIPEDALAQHPAMRKMAMGLWMMGDELERSRFVSQFELKDRQAVETEIIPALQQARQASGFKKSYSELFEQMWETAQKVAAVRGVPLPTIRTPAAPAPTGTRTFPSPPAPTHVPPSLSGVGGGNAPSGAKPTVLDLQTARFLGVKTPGET